MGALGCGEIPGCKRNGNCSLAESSHVNFTKTKTELKLDILVLSAHPDDAEISCGGTIAKHVSMGYKVGIVDFTRGELGTRGTPETRAQEASEGARILGVANPGESWL